MDLSGLSITNSQARDIIDKQLYDELLEFDKRPLVFHPRPLKPPRGRFARSKSSKSYRVGSVTADHVKRAFLSARIPSSSPAKSRLVEACLHLCDHYPRERREVGVGGKSVYTSCWKLIISHYYKIRARLCNSHKLLKDTNMVLFCIKRQLSSGGIKMSPGGMK